MKNTLAIKLGGVLWILSALQFAVAQLIVASTWSPPYSWSNNYISDLGNTACGEFAVPHGTPTYVCSPLHALMNVSFMLSGILVIGGALLVQAWWPQRRLSQVALVLWIVAGVGKILVGVFPENTNIEAHLLAAFNIPVESVAILLSSLALLPSYRFLAISGIVLALVGLAGTLLGIAGEVAGPGLYLGLGVGGMERVAEYPGSVWRLIMGVVLVTAATAATGARHVGTTSTAAQAG